MEKFIKQNGESDRIMLKNVNFFIVFPKTFHSNWDVIFGMHCTVHLLKCYLLSSKNPD